MTSGTEISKVVNSLQNLRQFSCALLKHLILLSVTLPNCSLSSLLVLPMSSCSSGLSSFRMLPCPPAQGPLLQSHVAISAGATFQSCPRFCMDSRALDVSRKPMRTEPEQLLPWEVCALLGPSHLYPARMFMSVDFPAPEGPMMATSSPLLNFPEIPFRRVLYPAKKQITSISNGHGTHLVWPQCSVCKHTSRLDGRAGTKTAFLVLQ